METCLKCNKKKDETEVVKLNCEHACCWICLNEYLRSHLNPKIKCPVDGCNMFIRDSEIRKVLCDEDIDKYEKSCLENVQKSHKCLLPQCQASVVYTDTDVQYECANCTLYNCILCQAAHSFISCTDFQSKSKSEKNEHCQLEMNRAENFNRSKKKVETRKMLLEFDELDLLINDQVFKCQTCSLSIGKGDGVKLRNCNHNVCRDCLINSIVFGKQIPVPCPLCKSPLSDREIRSILTRDQFSEYHEKCRNSVKKYITHFQCQSIDCDGFYEISESLNEFKCLKCNVVNCVKCKTVHPTETCDQFKAKINKNKNITSIEEEISKGQLMRCVKCKNYVKKVKGCNWIRCPNCFVELCWIRQMLRWGPGGRGDISGGCRCGVDGKPCHPKCTKSCTPHS